MMMTWGIRRAFGGIAVYYLLADTAENHQQKNFDAMLEKLGEYVASEYKQAGRWIPSPGKKIHSSSSSTYSFQQSYETISYEVIKATSINQYFELIR